MVETKKNLYQKLVEVRKECTDHIVTGSMNYIWINSDNPEEKLDIPWKLYGAQDDISKALDSGLTYSERYFILKFFKAPTDELDPDGKIQEMGKVKKLSQAQIKRLFAIAYKTGYEASTIKKQALQKYGVTALEDMTKTQYDELCKGYEDIAKGGTK